MCDGLNNNNVIDDFENNGIGEDVQQGLAVIVHNDWELAR